MDRRAEGQPNAHVLSCTLRVSVERLLCRVYSDQRNVDCSGHCADWRCWCGPAGTLSSPELEFELCRTRKLVSVPLDWQMFS